MRVSIEDNTLILEEVYNSVVFRTAEGYELAVCMRDDTLELNVVGTNNWHRADIKTGDIKPMLHGEMVEPDKDSPTPYECQHYHFRKR